MRTAAMDDYFFNEIKSHPPKKHTKTRGGTHFIASDNR